MGQTSRTSGTDVASKPTLDEPHKRRQSARRPQSAQCRTSGDKVLVIRNRRSAAQAAIECSSATTGGKRAAQAAQTFRQNQHLTSHKRRQSARRPQSAQCRTSGDKVLGILDRRSAAQAAIKFASPRTGGTSRTSGTDASSETTLGMPHKRRHKKAAQAAVVGRGLRSPGKAIWRATTAHQPPPVSQSTQ